MQVTFSSVGRRHTVAKFLRSISNDKDFGLISDLSITRVGFMTYYLTFAATHKG